MKKILYILIPITLLLIISITPKVHAYTLTNEISTYYNQSTNTIGESDLLDIGDTFIEYMYYNLGTNLIDSVTNRLVFTNIITTELLDLPSNQTAFLLIEIRYYNSSNVMVYQHNQNFTQTQSFSYFETNYNSSTTINGIDYITIRVSGLSIGYDEDIMHTIMHGAIIARGTTIINQTYNATQYNNGWNDAMNSKVTQIWSLWNNIFNTFMNVFDIFSVKLMGDITIGHIAMVPLVLGLIGFIYALGGKRGR